MSHFTKSLPWVGLTLLYLLPGSGFTAHAQAAQRTQFVQSPSEPSANPETAPTASVTQPEYPGGDQALIAFLGQTLRYPTDAYEAGAEGRVDVSFWIDETGHPYGFGAVESPHPSLAAEAIRAMKLMPSWTPGQRSGQPSPMLVHVPVVFRRPKAN